MGLDTSHNAWHGPYSWFNDWRVAIAEAAKFPPLGLMEGFYDSRLSPKDSKLEGPISWDAFKENPLTPLLSHSDGDGELTWQECEGVADALEEVIVNVDQCWQRDTRRFIIGCRLAATKKESLDFH